MQARCTKLTFYGLKISKGGVALGGDKVLALRNSSRPVNASEFRSFLGLGVYCNTPLPNLTSLSEPLWRFTIHNVTFEWKIKHEKAFKTIKDELITTALSFYNVDLSHSPVDNSPVN